MMAGADPVAICAAILGEARRQTEALRAEARQAAEALLAQAQTDAERLRREAEDAARREAARRAEIVRAGVSAEIARMRADRIDALLCSLRERARGELLRLRGGDARASVCALAAAAVPRLDGPALELVVGPGADVDQGQDLATEILRRAGVAGVTLTVTQDASVPAAGFLLRGAGGRQEWDGRLEARLGRLWPALRVALARGLGLLEGAPEAPS